MYIKRKVTPKHVVYIFKEHGTVITIEEAEKVVDFLYKYGQCALEIIFKKRQSLEKNGPWIIRNDRFDVREGYSNNIEPKH